MNKAAKKNVNAELLMSQDQKRLGRKKASYRTKSNVRACHESPNSSVA